MASVGYWMKNLFGLQLSVMINYSYFDDLTVVKYTELSPNVYQAEKEGGIKAHMWDTTFYFGVMFRMPALEQTDNFNMYFKILNGFGKSMYWKKTNRLIRADRFFVEGNVLGFALGNVFNAFNEKTVWFIQLSYVLKAYDDTIGVDDSGLLPEEVGTLKNKVNTNLSQFHLTFGVRLF